MEENPPITEVSEKEKEAKQMRLKFEKERVTNITLFNSDKRRELSKKWMEDHPDSSK